MSENENTTQAEVPVEEKRFGTDVRALVADHNKAVKAANDTYNEAVREIDAKYNKAYNAAHDLLGYGDKLDAIVSLLNLFTKEDRRKQHREASVALEQTIEAAEVTLNKALEEADPFTKFAADYIRRNYGKDYTDELFAMMPVTFDELKRRANEMRLCEEFEDAMREAVCRGALPGDTVEARETVPSFRVPSQWGPKDGETWARIADIPAYVRTVNPDGHRRSINNLYHLIDGDVRYEKVGEAPVPAGETQETESA